MLWWQWLLTFGIPAVAVGLGLLVGKIYSSILDKNFKWWSLPTWHNRNGYNYITFNQFIDMYNVNPSKWITNFDSSYVVESIWDKVIYRKSESLYDIELYWKTHRDKRLYKKWWKKQREAHYKQIKIGEYKEFLKDVQNDVQEKMRKIEEEKKAYLDSIIAERERNQKAYEAIIDSIPGVSYASGVCQVSAVNNGGTYTTASFCDNHYEPRYVHVKSADIRKIRNGQYKFYINGEVCHYFEADCGIPYLVDAEGYIWEVKIIE